MSVSLNTITTQHNKQPIIVVHGTPGIGKTYFAAGAEAPIFIPTEAGLGSLVVPAFPCADSFQDVTDSIDALMTEQHDYKTLVIDTLSSLEPLIWKAIAKREKFPTIERMPYAGGYKMAVGAWRNLFNQLDDLAKTKDMRIVLIAHSEITQYKAPDVEVYDRFQIKLHKLAMQLIHERADVIAFANTKVSVTQEGMGFSTTKKVTGTSRTLSLVEKPAFIAKNRYAMPDQVDFEWNAFAQHLPNNI
jgi:hypothetical protein